VTSVLVHLLTSSAHLQGSVSVSCVDHRDGLGIDHPDVHLLGLGITLWALTLTLQPLLNTAVGTEEIYLLIGCLLVFFFMCMYTIAKEGKLHEQCPPSRFDCSIPLLHSQPSL